MSRTLSHQQKLYIQSRKRGLPKTQSAISAGYAERMADDIEKVPEVREEIEKHAALEKRRARWTRNKMLEKLERAIDMAEIQADPANMIAGLREVGKVEGYYAPEVKKIDITSTKRLIGKYEVMSDQELLEVAEGEAREVIEGDYRDVTDDAGEEG